MLAAVSLSLATAACEPAGSDAPDTPRTELPSALAGDWFTGNLSSFQYYDRDTGEWQNPSGSGFYFVFDSDGDYESGAVIDSTVSGCTMRLLGVEVGTMGAAEGQLTVHRHWVKTRVTNTCGNDGEHAQGQETRRLTWAIQRDNAGLERLSLVHEDGSIEQYRRWAP